MYSLPSESFQIYLNLEHLTLNLCPLSSTEIGKSFLQSTLSMPHTILDTTIMFPFNHHCRKNKPSLQNYNWNALSQATSWWNFSARYSTLSHLSYMCQPEQRTVFRLRSLHSSISWSITALLLFSFHRLMNDSISYAFLTRLRPTLPPSRIFGSA